MMLAGNTPQRYTPAKSYGRSISLAKFAACSSSFSR